VCLEYQAELDADCFGRRGRPAPLLRVAICRKEPPGWAAFGCRCGLGAGFPGIPLAIFRPELQVTLIESHQRKAVFLREAARGLSNVLVIAERAESVNESFDWVVSRAVAVEEVLRLHLVQISCC